MKVLTDYDELVGKKIIFSHMGEFADHITLGTEDGCVLMATMDFDDEGFGKKRIRILGEPWVLMELQKNEWLRNELGRKGIFDIKKFKEEQRLQREREKQERLRKIEEKERAEYERLKAKFEN